MSRFLLSFLFVFTLLYAQPEETLQLSPQYIDVETISQQLLPVLSPSAQVKYLSQENVLILQDKPAFLAKAKILFELLNQPPKEIEIHLMLIETASPLAPTPQTWEELEKILKKDAPIFQSEAFLKTNSGDMLRIESSPPDQGRHFKYLFSPKTQGSLILLKTEMSLQEQQSNALVLQNTLSFKPGEFRLLATIPQEFHRSSFWGTSTFSLFVQCSFVPRIYAVSPSYQNTITEKINSTESSNPIPTSSQIPNIKLEGIIYQENNPKNSWAFINLNNSTQQIKVGMKFQGFELLKIENNQVLLSYQGKQLKLFLE